MKHLILTFILGFSFIATAQELPARSPKSSVSQKVGLCNLTITYSRPSVKGRVVFDDLVPYGQVWRLGANECTRLDISSPITIGTTKIDSGSYALFLTPNKDGAWQFHINKDYTQWGSMAYDPIKNIAEHGVQPSPCEHTESFSIQFTDITNYGASIECKWATTKVKLPFTVDTDNEVLATIANAVAKGKELEQVHYRAANYYLQLKKDTKLALDHIEKSIAIEKDYYNLFLKAQILYEMGEGKQAKKLGKKAKKIASKSGKPGWEDYMKRIMEDWN